MADEKSEKRLAAEVRVQTAIELELAAEAETFRALRELGSDASNPEQARRFDRMFAAEREAKANAVTAKAELAMILTSSP